MTTLEQIPDLRSEDPQVRDEMARLEQSFQSLPEKFYLLDKIGEGTFSCVYRAVDLERAHYDNSWEDEVNVLPEQLAANETPSSPSLDSSQDSSGARSESIIRAIKADGLNVVAVKRIHVTSSPTRIANELKILHALAYSPHVSHIITALRDQDQVLIVMQYFPHTDFRVFYSTCGRETVQRYMSELLKGLEFIHKNGIIHRDIKPTNFLYDVQTGHGVIVDFGLAEFSNVEGTCPCLEGGWEETTYASIPPQGGYRKDDHRPSRRANRAGTRGFRAPEVLFKCNAQTTSIDIWSTGVILLMFLGRRFPFFNSMDDSDALVEIATIFGRSKLKKAALLHGSIFETTLSSVRETGHNLKSLIDWCNQTRYDGHDISDDIVIDFLGHLMDLDFRSRYTASDALRHPFLADEKTE